MRLGVVWKSSSNPPVTNDMMVSKTVGVVVHGSIVSLAGAWSVLQPVSF